MAHASNNPIKNELERIQRLIDLSPSSEVNRNTGSLVFERRGKAIYCYECFYKDGKHDGKRYLGKPDSDCVREYCSLKHQKEFTRRLHRNLALLRDVAYAYLPYDPVSVQSALPAPCRRASSETCIDDRYEELKMWANEEYVKNDAPFPKAEHYSKDGTRVRSKGEEIEYNLLLEALIPFRYDCLISVSDEDGFAKMLSPDFLIQCYDGSYVIIEHLGWIGDKRYALNFGEKCYWYLQEGFVPGKNLFFTSDDKNGGTDSEAIAATISRVEELFWDLR